jgi:hypothetical protein
LVQVDLTRILIAAETLMDELENPHHIAILENYRRHAMLEYCGRYEEILLPEMTIEHPVYYINTPQGGHKVYDGMAAVRGFYVSLAEGGLTVAVKSHEHIAVADWGFSQENMAHQHLTGRAAREKGYDVDDLDAHYVEDRWSSMYFLYTEDARLIGEHVYHSQPTGFRKAADGERITLQDVVTALGPVIAAGPYRRLSVPS